MKEATIGFAFCGSFCTHKTVLEQYLTLTRAYRNVIPIVSEISAATDTRFGTAQDFLEQIETAAGRKAICTLTEAEPIGPKKLLDLLVIAPCTGNTIAKLAHGVTDSTVTLAAKAHLRNERAVVLAISTNDALAGNAENIGRLLARRNYYFVPFGQDSPQGKPRSLVADMGQIEKTIEFALCGQQIQPMLLRG